MGDARLIFKRYLHYQHSKELKMKMLGLQVLGRKKIMRGRAKNPYLKIPGGKNLSY